MENIVSLYNDLKSDYDRGQVALTKIVKLGVYCINKLNKEARTKDQGQINAKKYKVFVQNKEYSRPYWPDIYISDPPKFQRLWQQIISSIDKKSRLINADALLIDQALYTAVISFACCYDLWKRSSRKTPGTYFEVVVGGVIESLIPNFTRTKHVNIPGEQESVSTDIVFTSPGKKKNIVIPTKITTRERIVQPFAHQRILDSVFGEGYYKSVLICVSEMQRDKKKDVKEICVPNTIKLFQNYLAKLNGIYYLDPPARYQQADLKEVIEISTVGHFLSSVLPGLT